MQILEPLYTDIRQYLITALELTLDAPVVQGYNNGVPIPENAIIMTFRHNGTLDRSSTNIDGDKMIIFNSVMGTMQLDFYGEDSFDKAQMISTLWNSPYTTDVLQQCVPLGKNPAVRDLSFVNEAGFYELRFMIDLELQYNTKYEKAVNILTDVSQIDLESFNAI